MRPGLAQGSVLGTPNTVPDKTIHSSSTCFLSAYQALVLDARVTSVIKTLQKFKKSCSQGAFFLEVGCCLVAKSFGTLGTPWTVAH